MRAWPSAFWAWQERNQVWLTRTATLIGALAVVIHFSTFAGLLFDYSDSIGVVSAFDNDSAYGIETSQNTWLINHNGSPMYGPVYYRIGAIFRTLLHNEYGPIDLTPSQFRERSIFFQMMLINLIALYAGAFLLMWSLTESRFFQLIGTVVLVAAILRDEWRSQLLFMVKPDHLFAAVMTGVGFLTLRWLSRPSTGGLSTRTLALAWAVAASTKLSVIFFGLGLLSLWFPWRVAKIRDFLFFAKWTVIFYIAVGFPQNLDVVGSLKYLFQQSAHTKLVTWGFLIGDWVPLFWRDLATPAFFLVGMFFWIPLRDRAQLGPERGAYLRFAIYLVLSVLFLFSKETHVPHEWYSFPMVNQVWLLLALGLVEGSGAANRRWSWARKATEWRRHALFPFVTLALLPIFLEAFPRQVETFRIGNMQCRDEIRRVQSRIDALTLAGKRLLVDPYVPADFQISRRLRTLKGSWRMSWSDVRDFRADVLAFRKSYGSGLLADSSLADESRRLYEAALGESDTMVDPSGASWRRTHLDECGFSIWEK